MAVINFYDDFLDKASATKESEEGSVLSEVINEYLDSKTPAEEKYECYNAETGETTYRSFVPDKYKTLISINGKEGDLFYQIKADDVISVIFLPESSMADDLSTVFSNAQWWEYALLIGGANTIGLLTGGPIISMAIGMMFLAEKYKSKTTKDDSLTNSNLPAVKGSGNASILNNKYPIVIGKHLTNPMIIGSPYHVTYTNDIVSGADNGQYFRALYCVGYGPLYLSNFKIRETLLAYNTASTDGERQAVLHGLLMLKKEWIEDNVDAADRKYPEYIQKSQNDTFDILKKWKNNDVKLEILQFGNYADQEESIEAGRLTEDDFIRFRHGSIYPQTVEEKEIGASALFAYDKELQDVGSVIYKGVSVPNGYRTNTVKFSHVCPTRIQVEIDMPSGFFGTRTVTSGSSSETQYEQLPLFLAVQWRFAKNNEIPSDAESGDGWNTFDYMIFGKPSDDATDKDPFDMEERKKVFDIVVPTLYTASTRIKEITFNKGLDPDTKPGDYNSGWIDQQVFCISQGSDGTFNELTDEELTALENDGIIWQDESRPYTWYTYEYTNIVDNPLDWVVEKITQKKKKGAHTSYWFGIKEGYEEYFQEIDKGEVCPHVLKSNIFSSDYASGKWFTKDDYEKDTGVEFNVKERRYVFEKNFTEEECRTLSGYTKEGYLNAVEVRVIRLTPCYLDQSDSGSDSVSAESYQDLIKWTYLRTWSFDKEKYLNALEEDADNTSVKDYLSRPFSKEDSEKFTYIALELKQDLAETGGSSLEKLSCIAQAFAPNYLDNRENTDESGNGKWYPEEINDVIKYYHKEKNLKGKWEINEITKDEYEARTDKSSPYYYSCKEGTDYVPKLRDSIMEGVNMVQDYTFTTCGMIKYLLTDKIATKYLSNNTASVCLQLMFGAHLKTEAKTWSSVNKEAFAEAYKFYRDITDDTSETYTKDSSYNWNVDLTASGRQKTIDDMMSAGWDDKDRVEDCGFIYTGLNDDVYTVYTCGGYSTDGTKFIVATPIVKDSSGSYIVLSPEEVQDVITNDENEYKDESRLAVFSGSNSEWRGEQYSEALHLMQQMYYVDKSKYTSYLKDMATYPVNAVRSGCYDSQIYDFMDTFNDKTPGYLTYSVIYTITILSFPITRKTPGFKSYKQAMTFMKNIKALFSLFSPEFKGLKIAGYDQYGATPLADLKDTTNGILYYKLSNDEETLSSFEDGKVAYLYGEINLKDYKYIYFENSADTETLYKLDIGTPDELKGSGIPHLYKDEVISTLEQMKLFAESDGLLHVTYTANGYITKEIKLETLIQKIMTTGRSMITRNDYNEYEPLIGRPNPYPVTVLSQRNCFSKSNSRSFDETPSGYLVSFDDEDDDYESNTIYVMDDGEKWYDPTKKIEDLPMEYVTNRYQAANLALYNLAIRLYQRESYTRTVGRLGINIALGDTILLQDDSLLIGTDLGGTIQRIIEDDNYIYGFVIDEVYNYTGDEQGVTILQPSKYGKSRCATLKLAEPGTTVNIGMIKKERFEDEYEEEENYTLQKGLTNVVLFAVAVNKSDKIAEDTEHQYVIVQPEIGNMVVFGQIDSICEKVVVTGIKPSKDNKFELTLVPYNEELYKAGDELPVFVPNMSIPAREAENYAFTDIPTKDERATDKALILDQMSKKLQEFNSAVISIYKKSSEVIAETGITSKATYNFTNKTLTWEDSSGSNGWVFDYNDLSGDGDIYVATATAFTSSEEDDIESTEWGAPTVSGKNGANTATITLYRRSGTQLTKNDLPTGTMTYKYSDCSKTWEPEGGNNGWLDTIPDSDGTPLWVTTASVSSSGETDDIAASEWASPTMLVQDGADGGYQDYVFAIGDYGLSKEELLQLDWYDEPPNNEENKCLYMATKWISK